MAVADVLVVGGGVYGLTIAERLASRGIHVDLIEMRSHLGGNAHSETDPHTGIEIHRHGAHIFHTSSERVWEYVTRFTKFTAYEHRVYTTHNGEVFSMPITLATINQFFRSAYSPSEARALVESQSGESLGKFSSFHEKAVSMIGRPLYDAFIRGYTAKQWQTNPRELPASIITRLPVRFTYDSRYFDDKYQGMPVAGYSAWFDRMADHKNIDVHLETDFFDDTQPFSKRRAVGQIPIYYSGPLDRYFDYQAGRLGWRTLDFEFETVGVGDFQGTAVMNFADLEVPFTRLVEFRHLHPERSYPLDRSVVAREYSRRAGPGDQPYYPVRSSEDELVLQAYRVLAAREPGVVFGGRLGSYRYMDMHVAIASALVATSSRNVQSEVGLSSHDIAR